MEKQHISNTRLDDFFALARDMKPIAGIDELESQILNAGVGAHKSLFHNLKFKIVMSTSIIIIAAYITSFFLTNKPMQEKRITINDKNQIALEKKIPPNPNYDRDKKVLGLNFIEPENRTVERSNFSKPENDYHSDTSGSHIQNDLPDAHPLELDLKHLEKLGFETGENGKGIIYKTGIDGLGTMYYSNDASGSTLKINSKGFILNKIRDYYPVFISDGTSTVPENIDYIFRKENKFKSHDTSYFWHLVPVIIRQSEYGNFEGFKDITFWFKVTPSFSDVIKDVDSGVSVFVISKLGKTIDEQVLTGKHTEHEFLDLSLELKAMRPLQLDSLEMTKLGFIYGLDSLQYKCTISGHGYIVFFNTLHQFGLDTHTPLVFTGKGEDIYPVFISDVNGFQEPKYNFNDFQDKNKWTDSYFLSTIRALVPILVKQEGRGFAQKEDLIFWFKVTPSFLAALPDSISKEMGSEYNSLKRTMKEMSKRKKELKRNNKTDINSNDTNTNIVTCKYFDLCQLPLEQKYGVKIYPNPAKDNLNLEFWPPKNDGTVYTTVQLTDLSGKVIQKIEFPWYGRTASMGLKGVKPGIYLIVYRLNTGEVITNKVMITR